MSATFYDLQKFEKAGVASAGMTNFDKLRALAMFGGNLIRTITGVPPLQFFGYGEPLISYQIYGNMTQNGTPTPDDPIYPEGCGDRTENLFDIDRQRSNSFTMDTDYYIFGGRADSKDTSGASSDNVRASIRENVLTVFSTGGSGAGFIVPVFPNTEYTLQFDTDKDIPNSRTSCVLNYIDINENLGTFFGIYGNNNAVTFTTNSDTKYVYIVFRYINYEIKYSHILLCTGSASLPYVPYGYCIPITCGGVTQNIYLDEPLRKIGNYADEVKSDGTAVRKIKKIVLDGTENWQTLWGVLYCNLPTAADTTLNATTVMCDRYNAKGNLSQAQGYPSKYGDYSITFRDYNSSLMIRDDRYGTDAAAYKSYLADQYAAGTPVTIWYVLAEDQIEAVTLPQIPTISGQNTLSFGTALQPSSVSVTGHIKPVTS